MIHIGNQTSCWAATPTEPFDYAIANNFDAFEWFPDKKPGAGWDERDLDNAHRRTIRETALGRGVRLSVHARWQANPLQPDSYPLFLRDIELAKDVGAALLNIHLHHESGLARYVQAIKPLVRRLAEAGLQLSIENTPYDSPQDFNELFARLRALDDVPTHHVGMCLDLGHANLCSATHNHYLRFLDQLDTRLPIIHLHLHENWGDADTHLPLFTGPAGRDDTGIRGFLERLRRRNFSGSIILEQWPHPPSLLNNARDRLHRLLETDVGQAKDSAVASNQGGDDSSPHEMQNLGAAPDQSSPARYTSTLQHEGEQPLRTGHQDQEAQSRPAEKDFVSVLATADKRCRSWREKLDFVRELVGNEAAQVTTEQLVDVAIYLRLLGTGEIPCAEDGRHFRPAHHARIALQLQERLAKLSTPDNAYIVRKIYPWLPSSAQPFQRAEPLTRIRDIAHRNDIPSDLKREIKHSLQNKLHRCAGPEDLVTSAALRERITAPGANYSSAFVEQFTIFHEELKEFFNARSVDERLQTLLPAVGARHADLIQSFLSGKTAAGLPARLATFRTLTKLRQSLLDALKENPGLENQEFLLADIGLEDFAFVLLSEMINAFEAAEQRSRRQIGVRNSSPAADELGYPSIDASALWEHLLETLSLTITNLALSGVEPEECFAIKSELLAWQQTFEPADREQTLRLKGAVDRSRRLAEDYSDQIMALFPQRAEKLGRALGVPEHSIRVFCEADIRGHIIFQLSRQVAGLSRLIREELALPAWEVLVGGQAVGRVKAATSLEALGHDLPEPLLVLLEKAEGDEEIPKGVAGIVLAHDIPHLSHLGVRARQARVVFVTCEDVLNFKQLQSFQGQILSLVASPEKVEWQQTTAPIPAKNGDCGLPVRISEVHLTSERKWIPLEQVLPETGGGKAAGARRLAELARQDGAGFKTLPALVVPFGIMETSLRAAPELEAEYRRLLSRINGMTPTDFTAAAERLLSLVQQLNVPEQIGSVVAKEFGRDVRLIVRSSANCEDLEELAGAGLYTSVINVPPSEVASAIQAVWSSLWTLRATLSRQQAGIPHDQAYMAVLIQEMLTPDFSFILHTVNPINHNPREVYAEIAVGLGETLASAAIRGTPCRMVCDKDSGDATTLAFANFSQALWPDPRGGLMRKTVDYSRISLTIRADARKSLGSRLAAVACLVENALLKPQDIEGALVADEIYLLQARPQQGLPGRGQP